MGVHVITAAILAGGRATRFGGRNKAALRVGDLTILERQLAALRQVVDRTIIIANDPTPYDAYDIPIVADLLPGTGPLGGVYTAIVSSASARTLVLACDMPFLTAAFLSYLIRTGEAADIAIPRTRRGYEPLCATYSRRCAGAVRGRIEGMQLKISDVLLSARGLTVREIGPDEIADYDHQSGMFLNINTANDHARAHWAMNGEL
jgi:molybdopterin-guanine dinucleotide biosynthesis protein A